MVGEDGASGNELADQAGYLVGVEEFESIEISDHLVAAWDGAEVFVGDGGDGTLSGGGFGDDLPEAAYPQGDHLVFAQGRKEGAVGIAERDLGRGDDMERAASDFVADDKVLAGLLGDHFNDIKNRTSL